MANSNSSLDFYKEKIKNRKYYYFIGGKVFGVKLEDIKNADKNFYLHNVIINQKDWSKAKLENFRNDLKELLNLYCS